MPTARLRAAAALAGSSTARPRARPPKRRPVPGGVPPPRGANATRASALQSLGVLGHRRHRPGLAAPWDQEACPQLHVERLVNDERFVEAAVASRVARGHGPIRITMELRRLGVAAELITAAVDARSPDWLTRAQALRRRRFGAGKPDGRSEQNRQTRFLLYRGFTGDQARAALGRAGTDLDEDLDVEFDSAALEE